MAKNPRNHLDNTFRSKTYERRALQPTNGDLLLHTSFEETLINLTLDCDTTINTVEPDFRQPFQNDSLELFVDNINRAKEIWLTFRQYFKIAGSLMIAPGGSAIIRFRFNGINWIEAYRSSTL